jgi:gamma-butyrobetaine dioxygenase
MTMYFSLDRYGQINRINSSNQSRDSMLRVTSAKAVKDTYRSLALFDRLAYDPENQIVYKLKEGNQNKLSDVYVLDFIFYSGDCAVLDNQRIMHGRKSYKLETGGYRQLQGGYVDWDEINSRLNVLRAKKPERKAIDI